MELQINADRADAYVMVFIRPGTALGSIPRVVQLINKTAKLNIEVKDNDQPNFFVEAFTILNGKFHHATREIFVPPAKKALDDVKVVADKKEYLPGEKAKLAIEVKDLSGKPVQGNVLVSVYDRSLEQIAGDALPGDIREFFWKWRRQHYSMFGHTLGRPITPIYMLPPMAQLGIFDQLLNQAGVGGGAFGRGGMPGGPEMLMARGAPMGGFGGGGAMMDMAMGAAPMAMEAKSADMAGGGGVPATARTNSSA